MVLDLTEEESGACLTPREQKAKAKKESKARKRNLTPREQKAKAKRESKARKRTRKARLRQEAVQKYICAAAAVGEAEAAAGQGNGGACN